MTHLSSSLFCKHFIFRVIKRVKFNYGNFKARDSDKKASLFHMCDEEQ